MSFLNKLFKNKRGPVSVVLSVIISTLFIVGIVEAATTISANIVTGGTLSVTGASTLTGVITAGNNITVPAAYGLDTAGGGILNLGTTTATTINIGSLTGNTVIGGLLTVPAAYGLDTAGAGALNIGTSTATSITIGDTGVITTFPGSVTIGTTASTSALKVGDEADVSTINGLVFGFCTIPATSVTATSTSYADCTGATGVVANDRVFVQATSSLPANFLIQAASTTVNGIINVRIYNTGYPAGVTDTGVNSFNFWSVR